MKSIKLLDQITVLIKTILIAATIAVPTWLLLPHAVRFIAHQVMGHYTSRNCPELAEQRAILKESNTKTLKQLTQENKLDLRAIIKCEGDAIKYIEFILIFLVFLLSNVLILLMKFGFHSKDPVINAGLIIGSMIAMADIIRMPTFHFTLPIVVILGTELIVALMYLYLTSIHTSIKKYPFIYYLREIFIALFCTAILAVIAYEVQHFIANALWSVSLPIGYFGFEFIFACIFTGILWYVGWMLNPPTLALSFFAAGSINFFIKLRVVLHLGRVYQTSIMYGIILWALIIGTVVLLWICKKRYQK